jgi:hypothetical protein
LLYFKKSIAAFFFEAKGAKKKAHKKETPKIFSPPTGGEEAYAASTAQTFEKV